MTFDDDSMFFHDREGRYLGRCTLKSMSLSWPPPDTLEIGDGRKFERIRFSAITDEQRQGMSHVLRAAEYRQISGGEVVH